MTFFTHNNEQITGVYSGNPEKLKTQDTKVVAPESFQGRTGMPLAMLDDDWKVRPIPELIEEGYIAEPEGMVWDTERKDWRQATPRELVEAGRLELGPEQKIEGEQILPKTYDEMVAEGLIEEPVIPESEKIEQQLLELDVQSIRPLRAILTGNQTKIDTDQLYSLEQEAQALRKSLK